MKKRIPSVLLVGAGNMAAEYAKVLKAMRVPTVVVGNSPVGVQRFKEKTGMDAQEGSIQNWLKTNTAPRLAIVAVNEELLGSITRLLLERGTKSILVEKPAALSKQDLLQTEGLARKKRATVFIGYNRRFHASVQQAIKLIRKDGGPLSFTFDFTEWSERVHASKQPLPVKKQWLLVNSSHVIDLAFFLGGAPEKMTTSVSGSLPWHPHAAVFAGSGTTITGVPFSYHANWSSGGRWEVNVMTKNLRIVLKPLEQLAIMRKNSVNLEEYTIDDTLDKKFKPGLYRQVQAFLSRKPSGLATIEDQCARFDAYHAIDHGELFRHSTISRRNRVSR